MMCAWNEAMAILPGRLREGVQTLGKEELQELRLRCNAPAELVLGQRRLWLPGIVTREQLQSIVNAASAYSPWAAATISKGYLTAPGGHRIGLCGKAVCKQGAVEGLREYSSLCIRIARDYPGIGKKAAACPGSTLILGAPGWGKTTLLRDLIRQVAQQETVCVVDEREELFPEGLERGRDMDVLSGCPKVSGIEMLLRTMGPSCIAVDEITAPEDCQALIQAANCGVRLLATAHGTSRQDYHSRSVYQMLAKAGVFQNLILLSQDKTYTVERIAL